MKIAEQLRGATASVKSSGAVQKVTEQCRAYGPWWIRQLITIIVLLLIVVLLLAAWNWAQNRESVRDRLWGELAFFGLVIALGITVLSPAAAYLSRRLLPESLRIEPVPVHEALVWGAIAVIAMPIAMMQRPEGFAILVAASFAVGFFVWLLTRNRPSAPAFAICWFALLGLFVLAGYTSAFYGGPVRDQALPAVEPPVPDADGLARLHRPLLFFDQSERYQPLDIADAELRGCRTGWSAADCGDPIDPADSLGSYAYITVNGPERVAGRSIEADRSAIYYHAVQRGRNVHLDYWWFFEHNPSSFAGNLLCGQALRWLGEACAEHPADWEGVTVVLAPCEDATPGTECAAFQRTTYRIQEVHYAQHEKVVAYPWDVLREEWSRPEYAKWALNAGSRPLVFAALDSHASYAVPCSVRCNQIVRPRLSERRDGRIPWENNDDARCGDGCLQTLPNEDGKPSSWNAFTGPWGPQFCILFGSYCDVRPAPSAPAFQHRFEEPECVEDRCLRRDAFRATGPGSGI
jgi:hypothetical protein